MQPCVSSFLVGGHFVNWNQVDVLDVITCLEQQETNRKITAFSAGFHRIYYVD